MPVQKAKSGLIAKLGEKGRLAHEAHKTDETTFSGFGDLPAGIESGVAQLIDCKFDVVKQGKDNAGQYYFYAAGVVKKPKVFTDSDGNTHNVEGKRTSITEPLYETPTRSRKTVAEHIAWVYNELRKLGVDTKELQFEDLETTAKALKEQQPTFNFRTWKGDKAKDGPYKDKDPRTQHNWDGVCDFEEEDDGTGGVDDQTGDASADGDEPSANGDGTPDIDALVETANADEGEFEAAQEELKKLAIEAGWSEEEVDKAENWEAVAEMTKTGPNEAAEKEGTADDGVPKVGGLFKVKFLDPKTKKPSKRGTEAEIVTVNEKTKTVTVKDVSTEKIVMDSKTKKALVIKWDDLEPV